MTTPGDELTFLPLGGVGEIGMNLAVYGYGPARDRTYIAVDFGVSFAGPDLPGVDLIFPDIAWLEGQRKRLAGIVITHAHEDHFGALLDLWPRLRVPVFATPFTAGLLAAKRAGEGNVPLVPVTIVGPGKPFTLGPFGIEYINVAHSIPESNALAIRTPLGTVIHTGDWKLDDTPTVGLPTDAKRFREIGDEGVLALICDSTNALREGRSPSEAEVGEELARIMADAPYRIAFTTFASNVGRMRSVALAAKRTGRDVVVVGRAMRRVIDVAGELGMLDGLPPFLDEDSFDHLPRNRVCLLLTGSQGEPRAALARVAENDHRNVDLAPGDTVVFSSRTIPGNEREVNAIVNRLVRSGVRVITDRDGLVHVSGHPRRDELSEMYSWTRPQVAIPVHGEAQHLAAHADLARDAGAGRVLTIYNGDLVRLAPGRAEKIDSIEAGRLYKDGNVVGDLEGVGVAERRKLAFAGQVSVALVLDAKGELETEPEIALIGLPRGDYTGRLFDDTVRKVVVDTIESLPRPRRRDPESVREAVRRAVRAAVAEGWGKKPVCTVFVAVV
jgi:ribonuclease J